MGYFGYLKLSAKIKTALCNFRAVLNNICRAGSPLCEAAHKYLFNKYGAPIPCRFFYLKVILKYISEISMNQQNQMLLTIIRNIT